MTLLGTAFLVAYIIAFVRYGRTGLLAVAVCGIPFNSSAMLAFGGNGVSTFYVGLIFYMGATLLGIGRQGTDEPRALDRGGHGR